MKWLMDHGKDAVLFTITILTALLSVVNFIDNKNMEAKYSDNSHQIIMNSAKLAEYELTVMNSYLGEPRTLQLGSFQQSITSLEKNLSMVEGIDVTSLPKTDSMNYLTYIQDLNNVIERQKIVVESLKTKDNDLPQTELHSEYNAQNYLYKTIGKGKQIISEDREAVESGKQIFEVNYRSENRTEDIDDEWDKKNLGDK